MSRLTGGRPFARGVARRIHRRRSHVRCQPTTVSGRTRYDRRPPVRPDAPQGDPKQAVTRLQARATVRPLHRHQLLPERQILQDQFSMSAESQRQRPTDDDQQLEHVPIVAGAGARINSDEFWRGSVWTLHADSVIYRGALKFEEACTAFSEEQAASATRP